MMKSVLAATAAFVALGTAAHAQSQPYVGAGVALLDGKGFEIPAITGRAGIDFGSYLGFEAEAAFGLDDDTVAGASTVELDHMVGAFVRLRAPLSPAFEGFARFGYYHADYDVSGAPMTVRADDDDVAGGVGVQWNIAGPHALRAEYTNYGFNKDGHSYGLSYAFRF